MIVFESRASVVLYKYLLSENIGNSFLLPANICPIVPLTFLKASVPFEFVDISPDSLCIDEESVITKISSNPAKYGGVFFNNSYGVAYSPKVFFSSLKKINPSFRIIDDRCLCIPKVMEPHEVLDVIDLVLYSTGYSKYADIGFGGIGIIKEDKRLEKRLSTEFNPHDFEQLQRTVQDSLERGSIFKYIDTNWLDCRSPVINYVDYSMKVSSAIIEAREKKYKLNSIYSIGLDSKIQYSYEFQNWRFNIRVPDKEELLKKIFAANLFASSLYNSLGEGVFSNEHFPVSSKVYSETINLFNDFYFDEEKAILVCKIINKHLMNFSGI